METQSLEQPAHYFLFALNRDFGLTVHVSTVAAIALVVLLIAAIAARHFLHDRFLKDFEIEAAEMGLGDQKITFKANELDRTVAYRIWVELSTRKIGLPIDADHDVIAEIYDSWYDFFSVTRELVKDVPITKLRYDSTRKIVHLSIEVLNTGLRPHLTRWQARFRRWYDYQLTLDKEAKLHPQQIQQNFPDYEDLVRDMLAINARLMAYRSKMYQLVTLGKSLPLDEAGRAK